MSRIFVDRISPYQSGSLVIDGYDPSIDTGSLATTGSNTFQGNQTINGSAIQNFAAPLQNNEVQFANVTGATIGGRSYNRVFYGMADYSQFGQPFEDYFAIEYYDSTGYNFGSEFNINGKRAQLSMTASGSGQSSAVQVIDNYDGTSQVTITSANKIAITGKAELSDVLELAPQDPLPGGGTGQLAVSGSNLYYHDGSNWAQIN
jgi:hypothetical protein